MSDDAATFRRIPLEVFNQGKTDLIDELFAEDFVERLDLPPGVPADREGVRMFVQGLLAAFPDFKYEIVLQAQDGDTHTGMIRASGTMTGEFMGMPPSGKAATWDEIHIARFAGGKLAEHWGVVDRLSMLQQLGFMPAPPNS